MGIRSHKYLLDDPDLRMLDRKHGRQRNAKLTVEDVREIRRRIDNGEATKAIAEDFSVDVSNIAHIKLGTRWGSVQ
jgi:hypothetical protein